MSLPLHSNILGSGKPLLILHGFLGMSDNWKSLGTQYADHGLEVHLIDQRNHGKSFHSEDFDYDILAADLKNYIEEHRLTEAVVLGHSMGGKVAMQFAVSYPQLLSKLIVADIAPKYYPPHHQDILNGLKQLDFEKIKSRGEADAELSNHIREQGIRQFLLKNLYWIQKGTLAFRFNLEVLSHKIEEIGESLSPTEQFTGPTLFVKGDRSEYITPADNEIIRTHFPNVQIATIDHAGHWLHAENPSQFFAKTIGFIKS